MLTHQRKQYLLDLLQREGQIVRQEMLANGQVRTISGTGEAGIVSVRLLDSQGRSLEVAEVGQPVVLEVQCDAQPQLYAPPRVLHVVVGNLLRNACNYTDRGRIAVTIEADAVVVEDTGIGMSAEALARAFEPFYRAVPERPMGTGLGLSIVRRLADRFGWAVTLDSTAGRGTRARVHLAAAQGAAAVNQSPVQTLK